jgi:hypothetical protein
MEREAAKANDFYLVAYIASHSLMHASSAAAGEQDDLLLSVLHLIDGLYVMQP